MGISPPNPSDRPVEVTSSSQPPPPPPGAGALRAIEASPQMAADILNRIDEDPMPVEPPPPAALAAPSKLKKRVAKPGPAEKDSVKETIFGTAKDKQKAAKEEVISKKAGRRGDCLRSS